jgi:hypothetical protein
MPDRVCSRDDLWEELTGPVRAKINQWVTVSSENDAASMEYKKDLAPEGAEKKGIIQFMRFPERRESVANSWQLFCLHYTRR